MSESTATDTPPNARETDALLAGIVAIAADAIISMDEHQLITMFNHGAEVIFGYLAEEVIGKPLTVLMPERSRAAHQEHVDTFRSSAVTARRMGDRSEILGQRKSGDVFPAEASISKVDIGGRRVYTAVLRDITERKASHDALERQVEARTRELKQEMMRREESQAQLVRTQRMEAFGQLTGGVAHDFNNLLTVITGNLELLEMRLTDPKNRGLLQRAKDAADMGARLTGRLLTFARCRRYAPSRLNLNDLVLGMAELLERTLGEQISLSTTLERAPWTAVADPSEIENAILNMAINARDAMPNGGRLVIETANAAIDTERPVQDLRLPAGDYVRLSVTDTGLGMSPEVQQKAFEPFFTTKEPGKGTGLGLSTIYGFVQQLRGGVALYSEPGRGTTVNIYLPRAGETSVLDASGSEPAAVPMAQGEHILLVEDNPEVRATAVSQLEALGYIVSETDSGPTAVNMLGSERRFDLVFSDVVMAGGMSGFDVARWVRANAPKTRVLLASGYPDDVLRSEDTRHLNLEVMRKPYSRRELALALRRALNGG
jgi:PAS domain S-box-containing protein